MLLCSDFSTTCRLDSVPNADGLKNYEKAGVRMANLAMPNLNTKSLGPGGFLFVLNIFAFYRVFHILPDSFLLFGYMLEV
jgi:hypothetical protein